MMISHVLVFVLALFGLVKSADWLVEFGTRVARRLGVSDLVIGMTLTAIGTSVPELASSLAASVQGNSGLIIGNVVGSNIANIGLIAGTAALIRPFSAEPRVYERDGFILLTVSAVFFASILDNVLSRAEAVAFLGVYVAYLAFLARSDQDKVHHQLRYFLNFFVTLELVRPLVGRLRNGRSAARRAESPTPGGRRTLVLEIFAIAGSCTALVIAARYLVIEAAWAASAIGVPESVIGLSVIAVGTSLPELSVAISASRRGNAEMVVGNVMGSNLANTLLILGVCGLVAPIDIAEISVTYTVPIMLFFTLGLLHLVRAGLEITRLQGAVMIACYLGFLAAAFQTHGG